MMLHPRAPVSPGNVTQRIARSLSTSLSTEHGFQHFYETPGGKQCRIIHVDVAWLGGHQKS